MIFDPSSLKRLRDESGLSQEYVAKQMGWSDRSTYHKRESGQTDITVNELIKLAKILQVDDYKKFFKEKDDDESDTNA